MGRLRRLLRPDRSGAVVVTDLRETLAQEHSRRIRVRLVAMVVWIAGWVVAGALWRDGWLATAILLGTGPGVWLAWWLVAPRREQGRREAVPRSAPRELPARSDPPDGRSDGTGSGGTGSRGTGSAD